VELVVAGTAEAVGRDRGAGIAAPSPDDDTVVFSSDGPYAEPTPAHVAALIHAHLGSRNEEMIETVLSQVDPRTLLSMAIGFLLQLLEDACPDVNVPDELTKWQLEHGGGVL
jgi:hypothetical protein